MNRKNPIAVTRTLPSCRFIREFYLKIRAIGRRSRDRHRLGKGQSQRFKVPLGASALIRDQDRGAADLASLEVFMGLGGLLKGIAVGNLEAQDAGSDQIIKLGGAGQ